jgi:hypothetical protein
MQSPQSSHPPLSMLNAPELAGSEAIITEALVDEPTSSFVEPMAESIKDFEPVEHWHVPTTGEVVHENANNVVFPEPNAWRLTERDTGTQQITEPMMLMPIPVPVPVPNYDILSYSMNMGSDVWGGDPSSSSPIVIPSSEKMSSRL